MSKQYCNLYIGMSTREALEAFSKKHISEGDETECGYIANKLSQYLENSMEKEDVDSIIEAEIEDYKKKIDGFEEYVCELRGEIYDDLQEKDREIEELERKLGEYKRSEVH